MFTKRFLMTMIIVLFGLGEAACTLWWRWWESNP